jgi:hypothetical protein
MGTLHQSMLEYKSQLEKGIIQQAYRGLMELMGAFRARFSSAYPDYFVSGGLYFGYMDMTYFSVISPALKAHGLKVAVVFLHEDFRFEAWLSGVNRGVQAKYWQLIKKSGWDQYPLVPDPKGKDAIITHALTDNPDFSDQNALAGEIEMGTLSFLRDVENFLANQKE